MNENLKLKRVKAYTIYSSDDERSGSEKGIFKDANIAAVKAKRAGWYGSDGEVKQKNDIYKDGNGQLYQVRSIGKFLDEQEKYKNKLIENIRLKLTPEELELLNLNNNAKYQL